MEGLLGGGSGGGVAERSSDYYSALGCDPSSSDEQILAEYRVRARLLHPDKDGTKEEFQNIQEAKETLLDRTKRSVYDKWRSSGLSIPFKQWEDMKAGMSATLHWAVPRHERMLPDGEEQGDEEKENTVSSSAAEAEEEKGREERLRRLRRQDSKHPTLVMVNKWGEADVRRKFRNYEI